jgi:hypothetical protein
MSKLKSSKIRIAHVAKAALLLNIQNLESEAHQLDLHVTGHALNCAKNALGWEMADDIVRAGMAAHNMRPK